MYFEALEDLKQLRLTAVRLHIMKALPIVFKLNLVTDLDTAVLQGVHAYMCTRYFNCFCANLLEDLLETALRQMYQVSYFNFFGANLCEDLLETALRHTILMYQGISTAFVLTSSKIFWKRRCVEQSRPFSATAWPCSSPTICTSMCLAPVQSCIRKMGDPITSFVTCVHSIRSTDAAEGVIGLERGREKCV